MDLQEFIRSLGSTGRNKCLKQLYKYYPRVKKFILSKGGNKEDAEDIFQDALIAFCRKAEDPGFQLKAAPETYLFSMCKYMWKDELIKRKRFNTKEWNETFDSSEEDDFNTIIETEIKMKKMENVLIKIGERCLQMLQYFYSMRLSMKTIAEKMDFKSEKIAKNQKYKCLERAREMVRSVDKDKNLNPLS